MAYRNIPQPTYGPGLLDIAPTVGPQDYLANYLAANEAWRFPGGGNVETGRVLPSLPQPVSEAATGIPMPQIAPLLAEGMGEGDNRERWMGRTEGTGDFMTDLGAFAEGIPGLVQGAYESPLGYALPFGFPYKAAQEFGILGDGRPSGGVPSGMPQQGGILDWLDRMYQGADRFGGQQQRPEGLEEQKAAIAADIERRQQERAAAVAASAAAKMRPSGVGRDSGRSYSAADARERASRQRDPSAKYGGREYGR